jgi:hypothetical protein
VTPGGVGVVEGLAAAVLAGYGYPLAQCLSVVLAYRALVYWLPLLTGGVLMRLTGAFGAGGAKTGQGQPAAAAEAAVRVAESVVGSDEPAYVSRRRSGLPWRQRALAFAHGHVEPRTVLCSCALALTVVVGFVAAALPAEESLLVALTEGSAWAVALDPVTMTVCAYAASLTVPGVLVRDQGSWFLAIALLVALGLSAALSGHATWACLCVVATLVLLAACHGCFVRTGFLKSLRRLLAVLLVALAVAVGYAVVGGVALSACTVPHPSVAATVWAALRALASMPPLDGGAVGRQALWFFYSVRAVGWALVATVVVLTALGLLQRALGARRRKTFR